MERIARFVVLLSAFVGGAAPTMLRAQPSPHRFEIEPMFGIQITTTAPPPSTASALDPVWDDRIFRIGLRVAVRPFRELSRVHAEAVLSGAPQPRRSLAQAIRPPITGDAELIGTESNERLGDGRGPLTSVKVGYTVLKRPTSELTLLAGAASMVDLKRPMAVFGATGSVGGGEAVRMTAGVEWMGTTVSARSVRTQYVNGVIVASSTTATRALVAAALLRAGVQWRFGR